MRKFLFIALLLSSFSFTSDENSRLEFLAAYYDGEYEKAHSLLKNAYADSTRIQVWEERLHYQREIPGCGYSHNKTCFGLALLRIGNMEKAKEQFESDWVSLLGLATLSFWQNKVAESREHIRKALSLMPERPEVLFFAGNVAENNDEAIAHFSKYITLVSEDPLKKSTAEFSIDFLKKTREIPLNVASLPSSLEEIDSQYKEGRPVIKASINQKEKLTLLLDTGAGGLTLEEKKWEPKITSDLMMTGLGKSKITKGTRAVFDEFAASKFTLKNTVAAISPSLESTGIDGVAGTILFSDYLILFPLKSGKKVTLFLSPEEEPLSFLEKHGFRFPNRVTLPFYLAGKLIVLKGRIKNSDDQMDILLDTGAQNSILSTAAAKRYARINYVLSMRMNPNLVGLGGKTSGALIAENVNIQIGSLKKEFQRMITLNLAEINEALELELDAILGRDFLEGYTLLIDYHNNKVTFLK